MSSIENHWLSSARQCPCPNFDERPGCRVDTIVLHNISLPPGQFGGPFIEHLFCNCLDPEKHEYFQQICQLKVSAHLLIDRNGDTTQFVAFDKRAWHAGVSAYRGRERFNDFSIGIELEGTDWLPYDLRQYETLARVILALQHTYADINTDNIVGHSTIAPGRKTDPGPAFEWSRLTGLLDSLTG
jgi:AmpD protein